MSLKSCDFSSRVCATSFCGANANDGHRAIVPRARRKDVAHPTVLGYLGRALSLELSAVQLYSTQARLVETWGLLDVAEKFSHEAREEMSHADRIISRMLALGVAPNASQLRPVRLGKNLLELLHYDQVFEHELISLYEAASQHCVQIGDYDNRLFFSALLNEEQAHAAELQQWLASIRSRAD